MNSGKRAATQEKCAGICDATEGCVAFVYDKRGVIRNNCWCKNKCDDFGLMENVDTYMKGDFVQKESLI